MESGEGEWEIQQQGSGWLSTIYGFHNKRFEYLAKFLPAWLFKLLALGVRKEHSLGRLFLSHWTGQNSNTLILNSPFGILGISLENSLEPSSQIPLVDRPTTTQVGRDIKRSVCSPAFHLLSKSTCTNHQSPQQPFTELTPAPPWPSQWWTGGWTVCSWLYCLLTLFENGCNTYLLLSSCGWDFRDSS